MNRVKLHTKRPKIVCSAPDPAGGTYDALTDSQSAVEGNTPSHSSSLDNFDLCSWTFVETGRKMDTPNF